MRTCNSLRQIGEVYLRMCAGLSGLLVNARAGCGCFPSLPFSFRRVSFLPPFCGAAVAFRRGFYPALLRACESKQRPYGGESVSGRAGRICVPGWVWSLQFGV